MTEYRECEIPEQNVTVPEEILEVDPTSLFIGEKVVIWKKSNPVTIKVSNKGEEVLFFKSIKLSGDVQADLTSVPQGIKAGQYIIFPAWMVPKSVGTCTGSITITTIRNSKKVIDLFIEGLPATNKKEDEDNPENPDEPSESTGFKYFIESTFEDNSILSPKSTKTKTNIVLSPKGEASITGSKYGSEFRGKYTVDLQFNNNRESEVASGEYSGIISGKGNTSSGNYSFIGSGSSNTLGGLYSSIITGNENSDLGSYNFIATGVGNIIEGTNNVITQGNRSAINGTYSIIGSTYQSVINGNFSFIGSGTNNQVLNDYSSIVTGQNNTIDNTYSFIGSGNTCSISSSNKSSIISGESNSITRSENTFIGSGTSLDISDSNNSFIGSGNINTLFNSNESNIISGSNNTIRNSDNSSILSGSSNTISLISNGLILSGTANTLTGLTESELSYQTIVNGDHNTIEQSEYSIVLSGTTNEIKKNTYSIVFGNTNKITSTELKKYNISIGDNNQITDSNYSSIIGSSESVINSSENSIISSGSINQIGDSKYSSISAGYGNTLIGNYSHIASGTRNKNKGEFSSILGGYRNTVTGLNSTAIAGNYGHDLGLPNHVFIASKDGSNWLDTSIEGDDVPKSIADRTNNNPLVQTGIAVLQSMVDPTKGNYENTTDLKKYLYAYSSKYLKDGIWTDLRINTNLNSSIVIPDFSCLFYELEVSLINFTTKQAVKILCKHGIILNTSTEISIVKTHSTECISSSENLNNCDITVEIDNDKSMVRFLLPKELKDFKGGAVLKYTIATQDSIDFLE